MKVNSRPLFATPQMLTVDELTQEIRAVLTRSPALRNFYLKGELQGFKRHTSGHIYFTLLGQEARIAGVLFRNDALGVDEWACDGAEVCVEGRIDVYPARGSYQLYATRLIPLGQGSQAKAKQELKNRLEKEGLFSPSIKRPLPRFPERVALVTSATGAAVRDVIEVARTRFPAATLVVIPTLVQGVQAPAEIEKAFRQCGTLRSFDAVMLVRGGGSRDDLNTFDDERVVRAIAGCPFPVITGVGHQIDSTLADLVADAAAPTPSAAAEKLFPDAQSIRAALSLARHNLNTGMSRCSERSQAELERAALAVQQGIHNCLTEEKNRVERTRIRLRTAVEQKISLAEAELQRIAATLHTLSPLAVLSRGYALCHNSAGKLVKGVEQIAVGDQVRLYFNDGIASTVVQAIDHTPSED